MLLHFQFVIFPANGSDWVHCYALEVVLYFPSWSGIKPAHLWVVRTKLLITTVYTFSCVQCGNFSFYRNHFGRRSWRKYSVLLISKNLSVMFLCMLCAQINLACLWRAFHEDQISDYRCCCINEYIKYFIFNLTFPGFISICSMLWKPKCYR